MIEERRRQAEAMADLVVALVKRAHSAPRMTSELVREAEHVDRALERVVELWLARRLW